MPLMCHARMPRHAHMHLELGIVVGRVWRVDTQHMSDAGRSIQLDVLVAVLNHALLGQCFREGAKVWPQLASILGSPIQDVADLFERFYEHILARR